MDESGTPLTLALTNAPDTLGAMSKGGATTDATFMTAMDSGVASSAIGQLDLVLWEVLTLRHQFDLQLLDSKFEVSWDQ